MLITALIHQTVGLIVGWSTLRRRVRAGLWNGIDQDFEFQVLFWFFLFGVLLIMLGLVVNYLNTTWHRPAPAWLGWWLVAMSSAALPLMPVSGFWLVLALGGWMVLAARPVSGRTGQPAAH